MTACAVSAAEENEMANFGTHFAYPTPDWVAYRKTDEVTRAARASDVGGHSLLARMTNALRRLALAWVRAHEYNSYR